MVFHGRPALVRWTRYLSIAAPPLRLGASQVNLTVALPAVAVTDLGARGALTAAIAARSGRSDSVAVMAGAAETVGGAVVATFWARVVPAAPMTTVAATVARMAR